MARLARPYRTRRVLKWVSTGMCALIAVAFIASTCINLWWASPQRKWWVELEPGRVWTCHFASPGRWELRPGIHASLRPFELSPGGLPVVGNWGSLGSFPLWVVPLWLPFVVFLVPTLVLWRHDRRARPGHCPNCGYNLTGNVSGRCPECGTRHGLRDPLAGAGGSFAEGGGSSAEGG